LEEIRYAFSIQEWAWAVWARPSRPTAAPRPARELLRRGLMTVVLVFLLFF
jgi:hypothetical protein